MRNIYCSIGKNHLVADIKVDGKHSIKFIDEKLDGSSEVQEKIFNLLGRTSPNDSLYLTASFEPAFFIRKEDIPVFRKNNSKDFLYRTLPDSEKHVIIYSIPESIEQIIRKSAIPTYYMPLLEVLSRNFNPATNLMTKWQAVALAYLIDDYLYLLFLKKEALGTSTIFKCENATDVLYYLLLIAKQKDIRPENLLVISGGRSKWMPEVERLLKKYLSHYDDFFSTADHRRYFDLKGLIKCES